MVRCQNLQLNIRHEGRQPDICILIELNKALPIHIHILEILPLVITTSHIHMPAHLARADDDSVGGRYVDGR
jgi:hypothetical protein